MGNTVIQDLCLGYRCEDAQAFGAERGQCDCPCHEMVPEERVAFLRLALGEQASGGTNE